MSAVPYVELHCHSAYSFLDGASLPEELALRAAELGYEALALTDHDGVYGSLEFAYAARAVGVRAITGAEATLADGSHVTLLVETPRGYANLCRLLTAAHARERLNPGLEPDLLADMNEGIFCLSGCARHGLRRRDGGAERGASRNGGRDRYRFRCRCTRWLLHPARFRGVDQGYRWSERRGDVLPGLLPDVFGHHVVVLSP